ncbi:hypothetical protein BJV78DRAFT_123887 [Lactifluus subvellereus]|nr:hypothetical protein BJV78DRAFT_123887 [Lactifluus subvellereus]
MPAIAEDMSKETDIHDEIRDGFVLRGLCRAFRLAHAQITCSKERKKAHDVLQDHAEQQDAHEQPAGASEQRAPEVRVVARSDPDPEQKSLAQRRYGSGAVRARRVRWRREERATWEQQREEERRRENERRLEAQRQEFERKREARRRAEEDATVRTQSQARENSDEGKAQRRKGETPRIQGGRQTSRHTEVKAGDQKATTETSVAHLEHDTGAASLTTMNEGCSESRLIAQLIPTATFPLPSPPITPRDSNAPHLGHGDACGLYEGCQTSMEANYLFDPPIRSVSELIALPLVESAQTREDATDVLFEPSLERSGDSTGAVVPRVKICHAPTIYYSRNGGVSRNTREPYRGSGRGRGFRWRGRGGRGPRDETS